VENCRGEDKNVVFFNSFGVSPERGACDRKEVDKMNSQTAGQPSEQPGSCWLFNLGSVLLTDRGRFRKIIPKLSKATAGSFTKALRQTTSRECSFEIATNWMNSDYIW